MKSKRYILILVIGLIILTISLLFIYLILISNDKNIVNVDEETPLVSFPVSSYIDNDKDFLKKYENNKIQLVSNFALDQGPYTNNYKHYEFITNQSTSIQIILVNSKAFTSDEDLYKKMYISLSRTGNFIESYSYSDTEIDLSMAIMEPAIGRKTYMLIGGTIIHERAYYFQIFLGDALAYNIKTSDINDIIKFNHMRNPQEILKLLKQFVEDDIPLSYFKEYIPNNIDIKFEDLYKGNYDLPSYLQDRNN